MGGLAFQLLIRVPREEVLPLLKNESVGMDVKDRCDAIRCADANYLVAILPSNIADATATQLPRGFADVANGPFALRFLAGDV
jgi:hypothetical protein